MLHLDYSRKQSKPKPLIEGSAADKSHVVLQLERRSALVCQR